MPTSAGGYCRKLASRISRWKERTQQGVPDADRRRTRNTWPQRRPLTRISNRIWPRLAKRLAQHESIGAQCVSRVRKISAASCALTASGRSRIPPRITMPCLRRLQKLQEKISSDLAQVSKSCIPPDFQIFTRLVAGGDLARRRGGGSYWRSFREKFISHDWGGWRARRVRRCGPGLVRRREHGRGRGENYRRRSRQGAATL